MSHYDCYYILEKVSSSVCDGICQLKIGVDESKGIDMDRTHMMEFSQPHSAYQPQVQPCTFALQNLNAAGSVSIISSKAKQASFACFMFV